MRYLTLAFFLTLVMGFAGCGDMAGDGGDAGNGNGAAEEAAMDEAPAEGAAEAASDGPPQWQVLEQNVVHSE